MNIEKHHATGLSLAIGLLEKDGAHQSARLLRNAVEKSLLHDAPSYEELQEQVTQMKKQLDPLLERQRFEHFQFIQDRRIEVIVDLLFPQYNGLASEEDKPKRHPEKAWWWNGASIEGSSVNGDFLWLKVSSYIGGGETETYECQVPSQWLDLGDPTQAVHAWCDEQQKALEEQGRKARLKKAQAELDHKTMQLSQLKNEIKQLSSIGDQS